MDTGKKLDEILTEICHGAGVIVNFEPIDVSLGVPDSYQDQLVLSYRVCLKRGTSVTVTLPTGEEQKLGGMKLSSGEKFEDLDCHILVFAETNELKNKFVEERRKLRERLGGTSEDGQKAIGFIGYVPAFDYRDGDSTPACCSVRVFVPKITFDELLAAARLGRLPSDISIKIEGMQYDWEPDGSGKIWDNKSFADLPVVSVAFGEVPLAANTITRGSVEVLSNQVFPPTRSQINDLSEKLDRLATVTERGLRLLLWAVVVVGALILILRTLG